jgi:hypothetical protein
MINASDSGRMRASEQDPYREADIDKDRPTGRRARHRRSSATYLTRRELGLRPVDAGQYGRRRGAQHAPGAARIPARADAGVVPVADEAVEVLEEPPEKRARRKEREQEARAMRKQRFAAAAVRERIHRQRVAHP